MRCNDKQECDKNTKGGCMTATIEDILRQSGKTRRGTGGNVILENHVPIFYKEEGRDVTATAVGVSGEREECVMTLELPYWVKVEKFELILPYA